MRERLEQKHQTLKGKKARVRIEIKFLEAAG